MAQVSKSAMAAILRGVGAKPTAANLKAFAAWQQAEGGSASFNPFNTTQSASGASNYNSIGVRNYTSEQQGIRATVQTLKNGNYANILAALRKGTNPMDVARAIENSPWGTHGGVIRVLGGTVGALPSTSDGGAAGTGANVHQVGTGTKRQTHIDMDLFHKKAAMLMSQQASDRANGVDTSQQPDMIQQLLQARKDSTITTSGAMPTKNKGPGSPDFTGEGGAAAANKAFRLATQQLGDPYVWGGETAKGKGSKGAFDCSGLIQWAYGAAGVKLPRVAADQGKVGRAVNFNKLKRGDLLVENNGDHVVMYAGNGRVIEAPHTGDVVKFAPLSWFPQSDYHARRVVG